MCTSIVEITAAEGSGRGKWGWFPVTRAVVTYDHPSFAHLDRDTINLDFMNPQRHSADRAAVELSLDSAKALYAALGRVIEAAEREEAENRGVKVIPLRVRAG